jgi:hypothetical protein
MSQENVEVVRALYDEFAEGRFWTREYLFDPDVEYERRSKTADLMTGTWRGLEAMGRRCSIGSKPPSTYA